MLEAVAVTASWEPARAASCTPSPTPAPTEGPGVPKTEQDERADLLLTPSPLFSHCQKDTTAVQTPLYQAFESF